MQSIWKIREQRQKTRLVPELPLQHCQLSSLGVVSQLAFSDAGFYFCFFCNHSIWTVLVLLSPICLLGASSLVAMGSGQISFLMYLGWPGMGWIGQKLLKYTLCPVAKLITFPLGCPFFFATVCVGLNLPRWEGLAPGVTLSSVPLPLVPLCGAC